MWVGRCAQSLKKRKTNYPECSTRVFGCSSLVLAYSVLLISYLLRFNLHSYYFIFPPLQDCYMCISRPGLNTKPVYYFYLAPSSYFTLCEAECLRLLPTWEL